MQELFHWEDMGGFIRITGCASPEHQLIIPESIAGLPVKQIGDYAFRDMDILEEAVLPPGITRVGDHVFYNCPRLKEVTFWDSITFVGDGAFKNCDHLESMTFYSRNHHPSSLRRMMTDVMQDITVDYYYMQAGDAQPENAQLENTQQEDNQLQNARLENNQLQNARLENSQLQNAQPEDGRRVKEETAIGHARLMFPAFYFDYIENYPARIFEEVIYGTGQAYRQCFRETDLDYAAYDRLFERSVREDHPETVLQTAAGRLLYPVSLPQERRRAYGNWLGQQADLCLGWFAAGDDPDTFARLLDLDLFDRDGTERMLAAAQEKEKAVFVSLLMEYYGRRFARKKGGRRRYEL